MDEARKELIEVVRRRVVDAEQILDMTSDANDDYENLVQELHKSISDANRVISDANAEEIKMKELEIREQELSLKISEKQQSKMDKALEWAKITFPVIVPMIAYGIFQAKVLKFEETGSITSSVGRSLHLPRFYK